MHVLWAVMPDPWAMLPIPNPDQVLRRNLIMVLILHLAMFCTLTLVVYLAISRSRLSLTYHLVKHSTLNNYL